MDDGISMGLLIGLLSDMLPEVDPSVIESYVNAWLTAHPEATTTVQDGSITLAKLASDLAAKINSISSLSDDIGDLKSAFGNVVQPQTNIFNPDGLLDAGWTESDGVYSGTAKQLINQYEDSYPIPYYSFKENTQYTISFYAYRSVAGTGTGLEFVFTYTDGTTNSILYVPNSTDQRTLFTLSSRANKTVKSVYFTYSSGASAIWNLEEIMLNEGADVKPYEPYDLTGVDTVARDSGETNADAIEYIKSEISKIINCNVGYNSFTVAKDVPLRITNTSTLNNSSVRTVNSSGATVEQISSNLGKGASIDFTPTVDAAGVYFYSADSSAVATVEFLNTIDARIGKLETYHINPVPSYFQTALDTAVTTVKNNMMTVGKNGDTFIFITDIHWENNQKKSPALIKHIIDKLNINKVFVGGDLITQGERDTMSSDMLECVKAYTIPDVMLPIAFGNHDSNWVNYGTQRDDPTRRFDINAVYALICKQAEPYVTFTSGYDCGLYFDNRNDKTRYIFLDTGEDDSSYRVFTAFDELAETLIGTPDGFKVVIVAHIVTYGIFTANIEPMLDAYNAKSTYAIDGNTYDFSEAKGHVVIAIGGHTHVDSDHTTSGGIPVVVTTCDRIKSNEEVGTTDEQAFEVVTLDYSNNRAQFVRVGRGENRTFTLG